MNKNFQKLTSSDKFDELWSYMTNCTFYSRTGLTGIKNMNLLKYDMLFKDMHVETQKIIKESHMKQAKVY